MDSECVMPLAIKKDHCVSVFVRKRKKVLYLMSQLASECVCVADLGHSIGHSMAVHT